MADLTGINPADLRFVTDADATVATSPRPLCHARLSTTQIYTQVSMEKMIEVYDKAHPKA